ncbi:hypothetical protein [Actinomadura atramentaria]|uniref:hypothetical protein n=1 Tax=Actinomadura atramentaria TaxID=1990 RepID=UPI000376D1B8|nr:hypothetical protein [Actinomadura atramentaria]
MSAGSAAEVGARLRALRETSPYWSRTDLARRLRAAADPADRDRLPHVPSLATSIKQWETGKHLPGRRYRWLLSCVFDSPEHELFGDNPPAAGLDTIDHAAHALANPTHIDQSALGALADVLAGQRRLEDAIGPASLIEPVAAQLETVTEALKYGTGPAHDRLGRLIAEWTVFTGWLHAAQGRHAAALALFERAEDQADEFQDGTTAATAMSFRGYVARHQGNMRAVVRLSQGALAAHGAHPSQRIYATLQAAQGHAALGDVETARALIDDAESRVDHMTEPPPSLYWYTPPFFRAVMGFTLHHVGANADAAALITSGLDALPRDQRQAEWTQEFRDLLHKTKDRA